MDAFGYNHPSSRSLADNNVDVDYDDGGSYYNRDFYSDFYRRLSYVPKAPALLSIMASAFIIQDILKNELKRRKTTNQIMIGLSVADIGYALAHFIGTWAVVKGQVWGSMGTIGTCEAQGYLHLGFFHIGSFYNAALAITYVLMVRFGWKEDSFRRYKITHVLLVVPVILGNVVAIPNFPRENFNYTGQWLCSGGPWPVGCDDDQVPCLRGESMADMFSNTECFVMCFWLAVICATIIFISMLILYRTVLANERAMDKYQFQSITNGTTTTTACAFSLEGGADGGQAPPPPPPRVNRRASLRASMMRASTTTSAAASRRHSNDVAYQGIFYVWAYLVVSVCFLLLDIPKNRFTHEIDYALAIISPLQGFFNVLVYLRPRYMQYRRDQPTLSWTGCLCDRVKACVTHFSSFVAETLADKRNSGVSSEDVVDDREDSRSDNATPTVELPAAKAADASRQWDDYADCEPSMLFLLEAADPITGPVDPEDSDRTGMTQDNSDMTGMTLENSEPYVTITAQEDNSERTETTMQAENSERTEMTEPDISDRMMDDSVSTLSIQNSSPEATDDSNELSV